MTMRAAVDNDVILKSACYGLLEEIVGTVSRTRQEVGVLGSARFVVQAALKKHVPEPRRPMVQGALDSFFGAVHELELSEEERKLAAEVEYLAQRHRVPLDAGESQLCAVVVLRDVPVLATGDKRAIAALEALVDLRNELGRLTGRVRCLEQLILKVLENTDPARVRQGICTQPKVDTALAIAFSCSGPVWSPDSVAAGLRSYVEHVRASARRILAADRDLEAPASDVP